MPGYYFRKFMEGERNKNHIFYPRIFKEIKDGSKRSKEILESLFEIDHEGGDDGENEQLGRTRQVLAVRSRQGRRHLIKDVLPYAYHMMHPQIRDINTQLFSEHEKESFKSAIETMIILGVEMNPEPANEGKAQASFKPDLGSVMTFGDDSQRFMIRPTTQILIMNNFHKMATALSQNLEEGEKRRKAEIAQSRLNNVFAPTRIQGILSKKRSAKDQPGDDTSRFVYKFKEGHSKNFKRELPFSFFA